MNYAVTGGTLKYGDLLGGFLKYGDMGGYPRTGGGLSFYPVELEGLSDDEEIMDFIKIIVTSGILE